MNIMEIDGYKAKIEYDPELDQFRGEILGLNGSADFYGKTPASLRKEFKNSLKVVLEVCEEQGIEPIKNYSGKIPKDCIYSHKKISFLTSMGPDEIILENSKCSILCNLL